MGVDWLLAGLGNPGEEYAHTRHNVGFWCVRDLAATVGAPWGREARFKAELAQGLFAGQRLVLCQPQDFMNRSGGPVQAVAAFYKIPPERIVVVHDDLDLLPGVARLKFGGGNGGHNGLRDLDRALGTNAYWRLRLGIGHPGHKDRVVAYVLGKPEPEDRGQIDAAIHRALSVLPDFLQGRVDVAQQRLHSLES
ncbi:aminoacyl-tRNA hydrolase [Acidithiobacillus caldus]|nr:aminoacyl-tRNA hydrolase [Acidithiobacillus caldus]MBU2790290.1 aminoacyl-tRNA hydrolase [Acidithiobacillus caldus]MBU2820367.1 aminoacyl-tRNA hydrolase [Acidithiobacillus caldus]